MDIFLIWLGKVISVFSHLLNIGAGGTWPGHLALEVRPSILRNLEGKLPRGSVLITGTNGKTTTAKMLRAILEKKGFSVAHNPSGANLLNGIASSLISDAKVSGKPRSEIGIFEVDEGNFPLALSYFTPEVVVLLNLSRDQLDRYGEIDLTLERWEEGLMRLPKTTHIVINSEDKHFLRLRKNLSIHQFINLSIFSSHGPKGFPSALAGEFNQLNTNAAAAVAKILGISDQVVKRALGNFEPAFGRGEELDVSGRKVKILLAKNPASFNANLRLLFHLSGVATIHPKGVTPAILMALNDNIPDGRDVSWIFDVDFEEHTDWLRRCQIMVSGKRAHDLALRLKYAGLNNQPFNHLTINNNLKKAIKIGLDGTSEGEIFYILPTYSAMLEVRKILTGRRIS